MHTKLTDMLSGAALEIVQPRSRRKGKVHYAAIRPLCVLTEALIVSICGTLSGVLYGYATSGFSGNIVVHVALGLLAAAVYVSVSSHLRLYDIHELLSGYRSRILFAWLLTTAILTFLYFAFKIGGSISRGSTVGFVLLGAVCLLIWRAGLAHYLKSAFECGAIRGRRAVLFGNRSELGALTARELLLNFGIEEIERLRFEDESRADEVDDVTSQLLRSARRNGATEIVLVIAWSDSHRLESIRRELRRLPIPVRLLPDRSIATLINESAPSLARPAYAIELQRAPLNALERLLKRGLDLAVACTALVVLLPLLTVTAIAIKLDTPGPVIFKQRRKGFNQKKFYIYKFRTMTVAEDGLEIVQATRGDSRVTRVGRVLRESSIDELPQLVNVIRGEMSLVGPRPHAVAHDAEYGRIIENYAMRHHVKPGITGLAQVHGCRGETPDPEHMARRVELDIAYINGWSIVLDVKILCRTCVELLGSRNAY